MHYNSTFINKPLTDASSVIINVDEICTTSIIISLNTHSYPACENVSHNVTISGNVIYPGMDDGSNINTLLMDCRMVHCTTLQLHLHTIMAPE